MKNFTLLLICLLLSVVTYGQIDKGSFIIEASTDMNLGIKTGSNWSNNRDIAFTPIIGYFIFENFSLGAKGMISDDHPITDRSITLGPFIRYYYPLKNISPFVQLESSFYRKMKTPYDSSGNIYIYGGGLGISLELSNIIHFKSMVEYFYKYYYTSYSYYRKTYRQSIHANFGFTFIIGNKKLNKS